MSQYTSHSFSFNSITIFYVEGRGGYRFQTRHSSSHNPGGRVILLTSSIYSCRVDDNVYEK